MGSQIIRTVKGNEYLYYAYYDGNKKRIEKYCGLISKTESKKKALQFELEHLKDQKKKILKKVGEIETKLHLI